MSAAGHTSTVLAGRSASARARGAASPWRVLAVLARRGVRDHRRSPLTWGGGLGFMSALMAAIWPSIEGSVDELMRSYPEGLKEAFGIERMDSVEAYIDAEMLSLIVPLALAFMVVRIVTGATAGAEERGHLDTLLALPLARSLVVAASFVVAGIVLVEVLAVVWAMTWIAGTVLGTGISAGLLAAGIGNVFPLAMAFAGVACLAGGLMHRAAPATAAATGTLLAMYVIDLVGKLAEPLEPLRPLSAFRWYGSAIGQGLDVSHAAGLLLAAVLLAVLGARAFERRDVL